MQRSYVTEAAFSEALTLVAIGEEYEATRGTLIDNWPALSPDEINDVMQDALREAQAQGVEREDIDPSWLVA